jgi:calcineurin-like phosphoesterase
MCGARDSVLGFEVSASHRRFLTALPTRLQVEEKSRVLLLNAVMVEVDDATGRARTIQRVDREHRVED